jgi:hypothetical protein
MVVGWYGDLCDDSVFRGLSQLLLQNCYSPSLVGIAGATRLGSIDKSMVTRMCDVTQTDDVRTRTSAVNASRRIQHLVRASKGLVQSPFHKC